jgi:outer membrane protein assembly factor BamB
MIAVMSHRILLTFFVITAANIVLAQAPSRPASPSAADWPFYRGPNRNGIVSEKLELLPGGPKKIWEARVGEGNGGIAIVAERAYVGASKPENGLACLDANTGNSIWFRPLDTWSLDSTVSIENGRIYALTSKDTPKALCLDTGNGSVVWERALPKSTGERHYGHAGSPLVWQDLIILNAGGGAAVSKTTGEIVWSHPGHAGLATPVLFTWKGKPCVAIFGGAQLIAREARSGRELFQIPWKTNLAVNACDPIVFGEKIFLCSNYGFGRALFDFSSGQPKSVWEFRERGGHAYSTGLLHDGSIYCFTADHFACLDPATGQPRWEKDGGGSVLLIGDKFVRVRSSGELIFGRASSQGFDELQAASFGMTEIKNAPAYANGRLIARNEKGHVVCLQVGKSMAAGASSENSAAKLR